MPTNFRLATFNCENLFSRPRIFGEKKEDSLRLLGSVARLEAELKNEVFDHARIADLEKKLAGYVQINDIRGKHATAAGAGEWLGSIEFVRDRIDDTAIQNTARVIADINADVLCLAEVENRTTLQHFHDELVYQKFLKPAQKPSYDQIFLIDGNDPRGIDVAFMSRLPALSLRSHIAERAMYHGESVPLFSRDCLEVALRLKSGKHLHLLLNHFKSMGYSPKDDPKSNRRRTMQAERVAELADAYDLKKDFVVVAGDLNSPPTSASLAPLLTKKGLFNANVKVPPSERGTYRDSPDQIDYLLVSDALDKNLHRVSIERRGYFSKKFPHYDTVTNHLTEASDHCAVVADFTF